MVYSYLLGTLLEIDMKYSVEIIEKKFTAYQDSLVLQQADLSLKSVSDMVDGGSIDISPKYQRRDRWDVKKESDLIESFILNIPVPPIYLAEDAYGTYSVIDGKQRITAINNFINGKFKLHKLERFKEIDGMVFDELPASIKNALSIRPYLRVVTLLKQSDSDLKHEVFLRLNKAGVPLNSQEIRNVAFRGLFNDMLFKLSEIPHFKEVLKADDKSKIYREMIDVQFVLRFFTVKRTWSEFSGNMDKAMDSFMVQHYKLDKSKLPEFEKEFSRAFNACYDIWDGSTFMKPNAPKRVLQGFYDMQMVCLSLLDDEQLGKVVAAKDVVKQLLVDELSNNASFEQAVTQFTSNTKFMALRIQTFLDILKGI